MDSGQGFPVRRNWYSLLMKFLKLWTLAHHQVDLLLLDFSKAFDTVAHNKLLLKLAHYGIQPHTHQWIATWLTTKT